MATALDLSHARRGSLSRSAPDSFRSPARSGLATTTTTTTTTTSTTTAGPTPTNWPTFGLRELTRRLGRSQRPHSASFASPPSCRAPPLWFPLIHFLCDMVDEHGKDKVGIFRTSAGASLVRQLLKACDCIYAQRAPRLELELLFSPHVKQVDVVASVLKAYLREQSEPLIPFSLYEAFLSTADVKDVEERVEQLRILVSQLPRSRRRIFGRLVLTLYRIQELREGNKMDASNLAIVFAPSVLRGESEGLDILRIRNECLVLENCITHHARVFPEKECECEDGDYDEELALVEHRSQHQQGDTGGIKHGLEHEQEELLMDLGPHSFKREAFKPFNGVACRHCRKAVKGLRKAYQCQGCGWSVHGKCMPLVGNTCTAVPPDYKRPRSVTLNSLDTPAIQL